MRKSHPNDLLATLALCCLLLLSAVLHAQNGTADKNRKITGKVLTASGNPLSDVSVQIKGASRGTTTDNSGNFSLTIPGTGGTLVLSHVGYVSQEYPLTSADAVSITLQEDKSELSQVVVIGYGTARKSDLTGSVSSIKADELKAVPVTTFDQALQGRASGVQVTQASGKPGAETSIRIRGTSSINAGNEPLYVIDGMLVSSDGGDMAGGGTLGPRISPLASINPSDIESIEILKDASATAIYGSRGANGVVLITTKRGRSGTSQVSLDTYYGVQEVAHKLHLLNAAEFANMVNEAKMNAGLTPVYVNPRNLGAGTDWQDQIFRKAPMASYQLSVSGGDDKTKYSLSGSYFDQKGIIQNSDFKRYSFRANLDRNVGKNFTVGETFSYSRVTSTGLITNLGPIVPGVVTEAILFNPVLPVYDSTRKGGYTYENDRGKILGNPVAEAKNYNSYTILSQLIGNVYAEYRLSHTLKLRSTFGVDAFTNRENTFGPNFLKRTEASNGEVFITDADGLTWLNENTLSYNNTFGKNHAVNAVVGYTMQQFRNEKLGAYAFDFPDDRTGYHNIAAGLKPQKPFNSESGWNIISYLGRINYTLKDRYLFTVTGRVDGSSKFAEGNKYGFFPSGAFAWKISDEDFMSNVRSVSLLKLRTSYGLIGNQAIPPYQSLALVGPYGEGVFNSSNGSEVYTGREPLSYVNTKLKWETTDQFDLGFDLGLWSNRVSLTADYYNKKTRDLLLSTPIPTTSGFTSTLLNVGNIENHGYELDLRTVNTTGALKWNSALTFSQNRNKVTSLNAQGDILLAGGSLLRVGQPVGTFYGYIFDGIFQTDAEAASSPVLIGQEPTSPNPASRARAGDRRYRDINGDKKIDANDRTLLGSAQPKFTYGFNNALSYKGFDLSFFFQGSYGNKMANFNNLDLLNLTGQNNVLADAGLNRWTTKNPSNKYPRALAAGSLDVGIFSSAIVEDASYIRLKNVTLSYTLPNSLVSRWKIRNIRVFVSGTNLWTSTKYTGFDPEANTYGQSTTLIGIDAGGYPQAKIYQAGISAAF